MNNQNNILEDIIQNASEIPLECQEKVLDVVRAMAFTNHVIEKGNNKKYEQPKQTA